METLTKFLEKIPAVKSPIEAICYDDGSWWLKLKIDVHHKNSWHVVQELAHAINYLSEDEKLPTLKLTLAFEPLVKMLGYLLILI